MSKARRNVVIGLVSLVIIVLAGALLTAVRTGKISPKAATLSATIAVSPTTGTYATGTNFDLAIVLNTGGQAVDALDVNHMHYPVANMEIQSVTSGTAFTVAPVTQSGGTFSFTAYTTPGSPGFNGTTTVATVRFKALTDATAAAVTFDYTSGSTTDCNVSLANQGVDILQSVTGGTYVFRTTTALNINALLQNRTNHSTTGSPFNVYTVGGTTPVLSQNVNTDASGNAQVSTLVLDTARYDFKIKAQYHLSKKLPNVQLTNPLALSFGTLKGGDLDDNDLVNTLDFAILNTKWLKTDTVADINADGIVNSLDFSVMNGNWLQGPQ